LSESINYQSTLKSWVTTYFDKGYRPIRLYHPEDGCQCLYKNKEESCENQCLGKVPYYDNWPDREFTINDFEERCNVALAMGKQPNGKWLLAIDIDGFLPWWWFDEIPKTLESTTGRGKHYIFSVPPDSPFGNWTDIFHTRSKVTGYRLDHKGAVDIRYCRGAIVAPPSLHKSNKQYEWKNWIEPAELPELYIRDIINAHIKRRPNVQHYQRWSSNPSHKNKKP